MLQRVFSVGREVPGNVTEYVPFRSDKSLFDGDVILFTPTFEGYNSYEQYAGKPLISEADSQNLSRDCAHWRAEIKAAVDSGKVVFVALARPEEVYYDTGQRTYSGTGRSRVATRQVNDASSYESIPFQLQGLVPRGGTEISSLANLGPLAAYWNEFGSQSKYEVYFDPTNVQPLLGTKKREKVVGAMVRTKAGGALVFLPPLSWDVEALTYTRGGSTFWRKESIAFGSRLAKALVAVSDALRRSGKRTPVPEWATAPEYSLPVEQSIQKEIAKVDAEMAGLAKRRELFQAQVEQAAELRGLLYETGNLLEAAVLKSLRLLGFVASSHRDAESEFDAVFTSPEGRFLGEVEGKDNKAVNIDKMSQLERNLQEDFAKDGVTKFAKGVLFGNAYRLDSPSKRAVGFTDKGLTAATRLGVALVQTADLFEPSRYLSNHTDDEYSASCRQAIFAAHGTVVVFPKPPRTDKPSGV